jgi:hypothetical protein
VQPPSRDGEKSPDYRTWFGGHEVIVEVKQLDPNTDREHPEFPHGFVPGPGGVIEHDAKPGARIRSAISKAAPQQKALSRGNVPTMVVVFNNTDVSFHTSAYSVATAMEGFDVVDVRVPTDMNESPTFGEPRSGPRRMKTTEHNTTVSAVAVLSLDENDVPHLAVFHNRHARNPIEADWLRSPAVSHHRRRDSDRSSLDGWEAL